MFTNDTGRHTYRPPLWLDWDLMMGLRQHNVGCTYLPYLGLKTNPWAIPALSHSFCDDSRMFESGIIRPWEEPRSIQLGLPPPVLGSQGPTPQARLDARPSGSPEWRGSSCQTEFCFHRGGETAFPCAGKPCFEKLAAGVEIREAGEGYHQVTMATVSLASPSPNLAGPHQLVCSHGDCD